MVFDTIADRSAPRHRHMEPSVPGVCGNLPHMVWMIGKVESSSTFPTIMTLPTKTIFNGSVCLRWSVSYRQHNIVCLETIVQSDLSKCTPFSPRFAED